MPSQPLLDLIPWDPESPEQVERLVEQRIQCGWNIDKPESVWRKGQIKGSKCIYWIVRRPFSTSHENPTLSCVS